jgi:hypothetical protein
MSRAFSHTCFSLGALGSLGQRGLLLRLGERRFSGGLGSSHASVAGALGGSSVVGGESGVWSTGLASPLKHVSGRNI